MPLPISHVGLEKRLKFTGHIRNLHGTLIRDDDGFYLEWGTGKYKLQNGDSIRIGNQKHVGGNFRLNSYTVSLS